VNINEYQDFTHTTAIYKDVCKTDAERLVYCVLGLVGEAGEVAEKIKKRIRKGGFAALERGTTVTWEKNGETLTETHSEFMNALIPEFGDVAYYLSQGVACAGQAMSGVLQGNINKLTRRKQKGTLEGDGDTR
jgi:NTP pyrophosphatase (non-canonical NTP hydrolase)